jgi:hypothetical protein
MRGLIYGSSYVCSNIVKFSRLESLLDRLRTYCGVYWTGHMKKSQARYERAFEWLHSVQGNKNVFAEAASSKFFTGNRRLVAAKGERNELATAAAAAAAANSAENGWCSRATGAG